MERILVLGAGFASLWSAVGAAHKLDELGIGPDRVDVVVINRTPWHAHPRPEPRSRALRDTRAAGRRARSDRRQARRRRGDGYHRQRIYPPRSHNRREILEAAAPVVQAAPSV